MDKSQRSRLHLNLAKYKKEGSNFEVVLSDVDRALELRRGKEIEIKDVLQSEDVFSDAQKGLEAAESNMLRIFETDDKLEIARIIIKEGEIQLTQEKREELRAAKRNRIITFIHANGVDPRTMLPHPMLRLENAFEEAKIKIDEYMSEEKQVQEIIKKLRPILPIKFSTIEVDIIVPSQYVGRISSFLRNFGKMISENWDSDGSLRAKIEIPAGMRNNLIDRINKETKGDAQIEFNG